MVSKISICFVAICGLILICNAVPMQKRDAPADNTLVSDATQALDKMFEDINKGIKQLAKDGINFDDILGNITSKTNELGEQIQSLGKEIGTKLQETAKKQGLTE